MGAAVKATEARQILDRLPPELDETVARLALHLEAAVGSVPLRQPVPDHALAETLVKRVEGQGVNELLIHYGHSAALKHTYRGLTKTGYLPKEDGPVLVSFAAANPTAGDR